MRFPKKLIPPHLHEDLGWRPVLWLAYLGFLFMPTGNEHHYGWNRLLPTLLTLPVFLVLYFRRFRDWPRGGLLETLGVALLCYVLMPYNSFSNTYLVYAAVFAGFSSYGLLTTFLLTFGMLAVYAAEVIVLRLPPLIIAVTSLVSMIAYLANSFFAENKRKNTALMVSHEEIRRLAAIAERERIGRDLHDLLGHTLSLIAIKSELAGKLLDRSRDDREAAAREVAEVTQVAREALKQVRTAVAGIRSATLEGELVSARGLLGSSGVMLVARRDPVALPAEIEIALAMIVREATTNIHRHAAALHAEIEVRIEAGRSVVLEIKDDGCGGIKGYGNGLIGIAERVRGLGGELDVQSPLGHGTRLMVRLPLPLRGGETAISMDLASRSELAHS